MGDLHLNKILETLGVKIHVTLKDCKMSYLHKVPNTKSFLSESSWDGTVCHTLLCCLPFKEQFWSHMVKAIDSFLFCSIFNHLSHTLKLLWHLHCAQTIITRMYNENDVLFSNGTGILFNGLSSHESPVAQW